MRILVACEFSAIVRDAFRKRGYDAWSCDIEDTEGDRRYHIQQDVLTILDDNWGLMIAHPPCTYLTVTGNIWNKPEYTARFPDRPKQREQGIEFFMALINANIPYIAVENPVGIMSSVYRKPDQIIQTYQFGHKEPKRTCLWLKNLPKLTPTNIVEPEYHTTKSGKRVPSWYYKPSPSIERQKMRNRTFTGVAEAMADQWGTYIYGKQ